jgi:hypothetical protein
MYIKIKHYETEFVQVLNVNVAEYSDFRAQNSKLEFRVNNVVDRWITFPSQEEAEKARDAIFYNLGLKQPLGNVLDLTNLKEEDVKDIKELEEVQEDKTTDKPEEKTETIEENDEDEI